MLHASLHRRLQDRFSDDVWPLFGCGERGMPLEERIARLNAFLASRECDVQIDLGKTWLRVHTASDDPVGTLWATVQQMFRLSTAVQVSILRLISSLEHSGVKMLHFVSMTCVAMSADPFVYDLSFRSFV